MVAPTVAKVGGLHVERQPTIVFTVPRQSALGAGMADLIQTVLKRKLLTLAVSAAALENPSPHQADRYTQVLRVGIERTIQSQVDEAYDKKGRSIYVPPTLDSAMGPR